MLKNVARKNNKKREAALKNEAGGDEKHFFFTWPKDMCLHSHKERDARFVRVKRGKRVTESPSIQEQREAKRRKSGTERESSTSVR